jgi:hypothetical protein
MELARDLTRSSLSVCPDYSGMGSCSYPYRKGELRKCSLCGCLGKEQSPWPVLFSLIMALLCHHDSNVCRAWISSRLWKFWSLVATLSDGCLLGLSVLHDGDKESYTMASSHGPLCSFLHCICEFLKDS